MRAADAAEKISAKKPRLLVKTFALQALSDLSQRDANLRPKVKHLLEVAIHSGTPAMRARARNLLKKYPA